MTGSTKEKVQHYVQLVQRSWEKVKPVKEAMSKVSKELEHYFNAFAGPIKYAPEELQLCVRLGRSFRAYTSRFKAPGIDQWRDVNYYVQDYTSASVGKPAENAEALKKLRSLETFLKQLSDIAESMKTVTTGLYIAALTPTSLENALEKVDDQVSMLGVSMARKQAMNDFNATSHEIEKILPSVQSAIELVGKL
jgi:hypothetical protein